ncbi:AAA-like domain-containing protein [Limnoraphis robusta]|uniref:AAA-like domain-containing protein n=1 Tax=Limnoraphis robusta CCNP1315 TaxID=3110306 RepID=A0ABU5U5W6_9CYAN|nr:AAA-like domain-containing protein [Limnoraphis robusta]MEA5522375.1 AAA-like domain-containing protein [Limnoraphis robusta CCNP1315]MEA5544548.1 AAA-like domain-containing protein [Limnoraphis robusta CCNP1324]
MAGIPEELTPVIRRKSDESNAENIEEIEEYSTPENTVVENPRSPKNSTLLANELENPEGSVSLDSPFYIERPPIESDCYETILKPGALIRIKAPRQMGKTSLMQRILNHSKQNGYQTAYLNFQSADSEFFTNIDQFLRWFCGTLTEELELEDRLEDLWKGNLGSKNKCNNYFRRYLLQVINQPLTLGLDEVDQVFQHLEIAQEFFSLLRVWHENGKNQPDWKKLRLVIAHSQEVYIPLNINQSPFNVGLPIDLPELTFEQISELVKRHGLNWSENEVNSLMGMVDGHPYLVRKALYEMTRHQLSLAEFIETAPTQSGLYNDHLRRHLLNLQDYEKLAEAMKEVVSTNEPVRLEESQAFQLRSMGLIKRVGNDVVPLCNLYRLYFSDRF